MKKEERKIAKVQFELFTEFKLSEYVEYKSFEELQDYVSARLEDYVKLLPVPEKEIRAMMYLNQRPIRTKRIVKLEKK